MTSEHRTYWKRTGGGELLRTARQKPGDGAELEAEGKLRLTGLHTRTSAFVRQQIHGPYLYPGGLRSPQRSRPRTHFLSLSTDCEVR